MRNTYKGRFCLALRQKILPLIDLDNLSTPLVHSRTLETGAKGPHRYRSGRRSCRTALRTHRSIGRCRLHSKMILFVFIVLILRSYVHFLNHYKKK